MIAEDNFGRGVLADRLKQRLSVLSSCMVMCKGEKLKRVKSRYLVVLTREFLEGHINTPLKESLQSGYPTSAFRCT
jgi:hypothetical protein